MQHNVTDLSQKAKNTKESFFNMVLDKRTIVKNLKDHKKTPAQITIEPYYPICIQDHSYTLQLGDNVYTDPERTKKAINIPLFGILAQPGEVFYCESWESVTTEKFVPLLISSTLTRLHGLKLAYDFDPQQSGHDGKFQFTLTAERTGTFAPGMPIAELFFIDRNKIKKR